MVKVQALDTGWVVEKIVHFGEGRSEKHPLNLVTLRGEQVRYGDKLQEVIDFPGEYDVNGITVKGWYANGAMSYLVKTDRMSIGLVANEAALDVGSYDEAEDILCLTQAAADEAEKMELQGTIQLFEDAAAGKVATASVKVDHPEAESEED